MSALMTSTRIDRIPELTLLRAPHEPEQRILAVSFRSPQGCSWSAIGGGATIAQALVDAGQGLPDNTVWELVGWNDLHGD